MTTAPSTSGFEVDAAAPPAEASPAGLDGARPGLQGTLPGLDGARPGLQGTLPGLGGAGQVVCDGAGGLEELLGGAGSGLRRLSELLPDGVVVVDADNRIALANPALVAMLGYEHPDDVVGTHVLDHSSPALRERTAARLDIVRAGFTAVSVPETLVDRWGQDLPAEISSSVVDMGGQPAILSVIRDVKDRRARDQELAESRERYRLSFAYAPVGQAEVDLHGRLTAANPQLCRLVGYTAEELCTMTAAQLIHPDDLKAVEAKTAALRHGTGTAYSMEARFVRRDGGVRWVAVHSALVRDQDHSPMYFVVQLEDVTDRRHREQELRHLAHELSTANQKLQASVRAAEASEERYRRSFESAPVGMGEVNRDGVLSAANPALCRILGRPRHELLGRIVECFAHPEDLPIVMERKAAAVAGKPWRHPSNIRLVRPNGEARWVELRSSNPGTDAGPTHYLLYLADVTEQREQQRVADAASARFAALVEHGTDAIAIFDPDLRLVYASPAYQTAFGAGLDGELTDLRIKDSVHPEDLDRVQRTFWELVSRPGDLVTFECRVAHGDGTWRHLEVTATNRIEDPAVKGVVCNCQDITERVEAAARLSHLALHDSLTELPNRALLLDRLQQAIARAHRSGRPCAVLFLDLDHFKRVNDTLGHAAGDELLIEVANRLRQVTRANDSVARLGGDEFVVVSEELEDPSMAMELAERIRRAVSQPVHLSSRTLIVGCSVGIALSDCHSPEALLQEADTALYRAKEGGRDRAEMYDLAMRRQAQRRLDTEELLREAITNEGLVVVYQPIVRLNDRSVVGTEALVRLRQPAGGLLTPDHFISVAEDSGLIMPLGAAVLDLACAQQALWSAGATTRPPGHVSVNLSGRQLSSPALVAQVAAVLEARQLAAGQLCLELTESTLIDASPATLRTIEDLKGMGISLAIDDFGTGWSSLAYLRRFPIDTLKIDRSFVAGLGTDDDDTEVVRAVIGLGHALGKRTVAEGVETEGQAELLQQLGCDDAQGYLFGRPQLPADVTF
jgi:diguanylate cyclase (GGDEF)-like protein/PAS domain S-box-containing protein